MPTLNLKLVTDRFDQKAHKSQAALKTVAVQAGKTETAVDRMATLGSRGLAMFAGKAKLAGVALGAFASAMAVKGVSQARKFDAALAEVSTLIEGTAAQMGFLQTAAFDLANTFGTTATDQVSAFYQAISAGAGTVQQAQILLVSANKLAVGGITDTKTAVDILTTATNAYADTGLTAAQASDILFTGVKAGKTTVQELAARLGNVIPIASSMGIGLDQLVGSIAALTTQGQNTALAVTGVRAAMSGILKPTSEAQKVAKALGIEFNAAALKAKGFGGFMADVVDKTHGSKEAIASLFGSVEALTAVLAFAGNAGGKYSETMALMADASGATDAALKKVLGSLSGRMNKALKTFGTELTKIGINLLKVITPAVEYLAKHLGVLKVGLVAVGVALAVAFAPITGIIIAATGAIALLAGAFAPVKETAFNAALGISTVNTMLDQFATGTAPAAGQAAVDLAAKNLVQAQSEYDVANAIVAKNEAELSAMKATVDAQANMGFQNPDVMKVLGFSATDLQHSRDRLKALAKDLADTQDVLNRARSSLLVSPPTPGASGSGTTPAEKAQDKALKRVQDLLAQIKAGGSGATASVKGISKALKKVPTAAEAAAKSMNQVADAIGNTLGSGFMDMVTGTKTVAESFRSMAADIIRELYKVLVVQRMVANLKTIFGGGVSGGSLGKMLMPGLFSYAGGGSTGNGPRSGGLDGQGGFLAMMHPRETVTDHTRPGNGAGANITINQTFTGGVTRADLGNALPHIVDASKAAVLDAMRRHQGGFA